MARLISTARIAVEDRGDRAKSNRMGEGQPGGRTETTGQAPQERRDSDRKEPRATEEKKYDGKASEDRGSVRDNERSRDTTGQGTAPTKGPNANLSVNITPETAGRRMPTAPTRGSESLASFW
jgi:hypothetical protein